MLILVTGDRHWTDVAAIGAAFDAVASSLPPDAPPSILHGGARGADRIAGAVAAARGWHVDVVPARWDLYGRAAGPIRNGDMLLRRPDLVLAFHPDLRTSRGTADMVRKARAAGVRVVVITGAPEAAQERSRTGATPGDGV